MDYSGYDDRYEHTHTTGSLDRGESILEEDEEYDESPPPKPVTVPSMQTTSPPPSLPPSGMGSLEAEVCVCRGCQGGPFPVTHTSSA